MIGRTARDCMADGVFDTVIVEGLERGNVNETRDSGGHRDRDTVTQHNGEIARYNVTCAIRAQNYIR